MFCTIPAGWFLMGSTNGLADERPVRSVWVDRFAMAPHPVTRAEYAAFVEATGHPLPREWHDPAFAAPDLPVVGVSWHDALAYCAWASTPERVLRLPTEAEWERAARGGLEGASYPWGEVIPAWIPDHGRGPLPAPWPVTDGEPNGFGLFGIAGNIHEWCADWYAADTYATAPDRNPTGPPAGQRRASRGGAWRHAVTISRCAARSRIDPTFRYTDYGFRVVTTQA
jgi:formylglycine-generating enzyme required for sulfatase activity